MHCHNVCVGSKEMTRPSKYSKNFRKQLNLNVVLSETLFRSSPEYQPVDASTHLCYLIPNVRCVSINVDISNSESLDNLDNSTMKSNYSLFNSFDAVSSGMMTVYTTEASGVWSSITSLSASKAAFRYFIETDWPLSTFLARFYRQGSILSLWMEVQSYSVDSIWDEREQRAWTNRPSPRTAFWYLDWNFCISLHIHSMSISHQLDGMYNNVQILVSLTVWRIIYPLTEEYSIICY